MFGHRCWIGLVAVVALGVFGTSVHADFDNMEGTAIEETSIETKLGYRGVSAHGAPGRAREYDSLKASPTFGLAAKKYGGGLNMSLIGSYLNEDEHALEGDVNYRSQLRLQVLSDRFYHNLDHIPYDPAYSPEARQDGTYFSTNGNSSARTDFSDTDPARTYGIQLDRNEARLRAKLPDYPAHLNLKYWRWEKEGHKQLRYVNENCASSCHMRSTTQKIDRVTEEVTAGLDGHVGFFDLAFEQIFRTFKDKAKTPYDSFDAHQMRATGSYQHDAAPDSTYRQSTLKANTTLGGGLVVSASYALGKRENESNLFDVAPVEAETDFNKLASDVTYTPSANWTFNFRYRLLDLEQSNSSTLTAAGAEYVVVNFPTTSGPRNFPYQVRDNIDISRDFYAASVAYRPTPRLTLKADYQREDIHRGRTDGPIAHSSRNVDPVAIDPYWELPEDEVIQKLRLGVSSRHLERNALRLKAWYEYQTSDDPAYNTSIDEGHTLFASAIYRPGLLWGTNASVRFKQSENNNHAHSQFEGGDVLHFYQDRDHQQQQASLGLWVTPVERLNLDLNYGYLRTRIIQDLLFGAEPSQTNPRQDFTIEDDDVEYRQSVHTLSLGATVQASQSVQCRLEGYHIRSESTYSPGFETLTYDYQIGGGALDPGLASPDGLRQISKVDIRQNGIRGRVDWKVDEDWTASFEASYDDYDDHGADAFDGSVQTYLCSLTRLW